MSVGLLPRIGEISYNGFVFSSACETTALDIVPVMDEAKRTVIYNKFTFTIKDYITGRPTDSQCSYAKMVLSKNGGVFKYVNRGLGNIIVNTGSVKDVDYGPKCVSLSMRPIGGRQATELIWTVEICVPDCTSARYAFAPMEFNFKLSFNQDKHGLTTRTYSGFIRIPMTRNGPGDRALSDSVDNYREQIYIPLLPQFGRERSEFNISTDKRRLDFTIVDQEFYGPAPPPGVTEWDGQHTIASSEIGLVKWVGTVNAWYAVAPGFSKSVAADHFLKLATDRISYSANVLGKSQQSFILLTFTAGEPSMTQPRNTQFSLSYSFVTTLSTILSGSGLWREVPGSDWRTWASSMSGVLGSRGLAGLRFSTNEDRIVDLCGSPQTVSLSGGRPRVNGGTSIIDIFAGNCPPPAESWLSYDCQLSVEADDGVTSTRLLPKEPIKRTFQTQLVSGGQYGVPVLPAAQGQPTGAVKVPLWNNLFDGAGVLEPTVQQRTAPLVYVYLIGKAARACYPIPIPELEETAELKPVKANRLDYGEGFTQGIAYNSGLPIYTATWKMRYAVEKHKVNKIPIPTQPFAARRSR